MASKTRYIIGSRRGAESLPHVRQVVRQFVAQHPGAVLLKELAAGFQSSR